MKKNCNFICEYLDEAGECEAVQTECVGDMCECWKNCQSCTRSEDCENVMIQYINVVKCGERMKDNTVNVNGIDVYLHDIYYYSDKYIAEELEISRDDPDYRQIVSDNFVSMILYIHDNIQKPSNDDIKLLDDIFNIYIRLCSKYRVLPTLECFSFLVGVERRTFTDWSNGKTRRSTHPDTVKKWFDTCKSFTVNRLSNQRGTDANLIFVAKAAYGMAEAVPTQPAEPQGIPQQSREEIAARHAGYIGVEEPERPEL